MRQKPEIPAETRSKIPKPHPQIARLCQIPIGVAKTMGYAEVSYYNKYLAKPKIITLNGWRKTVDLSDEDRNSSENRKMAKLLTAMSVVVPDNGYILYGDNNRDDDHTDHYHLYYDFYSFDIGRPTGPRVKVSKLWRRKLRSASRWAFGLSCTRNQGCKVWANFFQRSKLYIHHTAYEG